MYSIRQQSRQTSRLSFFLGFFNGATELSGVRCIVPIRIAKGII
jgi:hypothetical protein